MSLDTPITILPSEVLSHILSFLDTPDRSNLASCARASKQFHHAATPILYSHVVLRSDQDLGMLLPQFSVEGENRRKDLLKHVQIMTIGNERNRDIWSLSKVCEGWESSGLCTIRIACGSYLLPWRLLSMINLMKPTKIIFETIVHKVLTWLRLRQPRFLFILRSLEERATVIFEMDHGPVNIPLAPTDSQASVNPVYLSLPKIDQVKKLVWIFPPGRTDLYEAIGTSLIKTSTYLPLDAEMILVHRFEGINQHADSNAMRYHEVFHSSLPKSTIREELLNAVPIRTPPIDEISKGISIGDYIEKRMEKIRFLSTEEYYKSE
ncbi:hypothetical protein I203_107269 [Kwoniella mangroviensis CBS 8507]|uniref:hypothetical protein n=1 Tax=Kwoniella mangroviensis CBS 8507 TaxID=1296122 RepID=UPI00080D2125|nr:uncharacterized protein I203_02016 [Kwoniella mangroviensis CBS 8507]OCF68632.1 hypothetical protein I203_02016 [Kwoniella mangroviensis CBS 8507]